MPHKTQTTADMRHQAAELFLDGANPEGPLVALQLASESLVAYASRFAGQLPQAAEAAIDVHLAQLALARAQLQALGCALVGDGR